MKLTTIRSAIRIPSSILSTPKRLYVASFVVAFALFGTVVLLAVMAASNSEFTVNPLKGTLSGNVAIVQNKSAIKGQAVQFGSGSTGTGSGGSTTGSGLAGCTYNNVPAPCIGSPAAGASGWGAPVFDSEFNGNSLNKSKWSTNIEYGDNTENNVKVSPTNVSVSGGNLILTLSSSHLGANVSTDPMQGIKGFQFGDGYFVEARIYFPGNGTDIFNWPAFWTVNNNWPQNGEIDIAEGNGTLTSNYHSSAGSQNYDIPGVWSNAWHTYAVDREAGRNYIYWDGKLVKSYATSDGGAQHYITLNVGNITGPNCACANTAVYGKGSQVRVDYVRVWKKQ